MFGLFKSETAPEGPVEFENEIEIEASAEQVYRLLDFGDPANAHRALGHTVIDLGGGGRFELQLAEMPGVEFFFVIEEAVPPSRYVYTSTIEPKGGNLVSDRETYTIEAIGPNKCKVTQKTEVQFVEGLRLKKFASEVSTMAAAVANSQFKLKLHAEEGVEAVKEYEEQLWG